MSIRRRSVGVAVRSTSVVSPAFSETFTGITNGSSWGSNWTNPRTTTGATVNVQNSQGSVATGTLSGYTGKAGIQSVASFTDFDLYADVNILATGEYYPMIGFRSSSTWSPIHASMLDSYWFEIKRNENSFHLYKRVGDTPTLLASTAYTITTGDTIHVHISAQGSALKVRVWKNAEPEPGIAPSIHGFTNNGGEFGVGANLSTGSGGTFSNTNLGTYGSDYQYDGQTSLNYLAGRGIRYLRVGTRWERLQPTLSAALDTTELSRLDAYLDRCTAAGVKAILGLPCSYGAYWVGSGGVGVRHAIGTAPVTQAAFVDFWTRFSAKYKDHPAVHAYTLNGEPTNMANAAAWESASQAALNAIRANGDTRLVVVSTYNFSSMTVLATEHPAGPWITDSANNFAYDCHQYPGTYFGDVEGGSFSYASANAAAVAAGYASLTAFELTARAGAFNTWLNGARGFVGEIGWPNSRRRPTDYANWNAVGAALIDYYNSKGWNWLIWGVGEFWGPGNLSWTDSQYYIFLPYSATGSASVNSLESNAAVIEPRLSSWQQEVTDTHVSAGQIYLSNHGGADAVSDEVRYDNIIVYGVAVAPNTVIGSLTRTLGSVSPNASGSGPPAPTPTNTSQVGATWTRERPAASMDSTMAANIMQAQHIVEHGAGNPWPTQASMSAPQWGQLDPYMQDVRDAGAVQKAIIFNKAPRWMVADPGGPDDQRPTNANFDNFATISAQSAARYTDFQWGSVWNEYKAFWNNTLNRPDWENYTIFYNKVYNAVKAVRPTMKVGGPYTTQISSSYQRGETTTIAQFPGGYFDARWMAAMTHFINNCPFDFLSFDMGIENSVNNFGGAYFGADPQQQIQKFANFVAWIRSHGGTAATVPIIGFETYVHVAGFAVGSGGYGYSQAQLEDLYIELCRQTQAASPNGPCYWMTWCEPSFYPQVVNPTGTPAAPTHVWANTTSGFKAKVDAWHATQGGTPSTFVDTLTMFRNRYPAGGAEIWVDPAGNDANPGTSGSPKKTVQGAINAAVAGSQIRVRAGTYNDGFFSWAGKNGNASNWIQLRLEPGAIMHVAGGDGGQGLCKFQNCSFIAVYGGEWVGLNVNSQPYEVCHLAQFNAHSCAVWGGTYHDIGGHFFAALNTPGRFDICYNRGYRLARWNPFQASAISVIGLTNPPVAAWPDGYQNHIIGNVIDATWTDLSVQDPTWGITDGNAIILDYSGSLTGRTLVAKNLTVGCGGRGIHDLGVHHADIYLNTCCDNSQNLAGSWIGEISITEAADSHAAWNLAAARVGNNRVGIFANPGAGSTWSDTVFLRGTGGEDSVSPGANQFNNVNRTATGPANYFVQYQQGVHQQVSITNIAGFRPKLAQVQKFTPSAALRSLMSSWPDALGYLPPATGQWAYGAFEAA